MRKLSINPNLFRNAFRRRRSIRFHFNPERDWLILLACATVLLIVSGLFAAFLFFQVTRDDDFPSQQSQVEQSLDEELLVGTLSFFRERREHFTLLLGRPPTLVDPSI